MSGTTSRGDMGRLYVQRCRNRKRTHGGAANCGSELADLDARADLVQRQPAVAERSQVAPLHAQDNRRRLLIAGPHPAIDAEDPGAAGYTGSLVVVDFPSLEAATAWANEDPYISAGVYARVTVKPFRRVLP